MDTKKNTIVVGVTGGIAAFKAFELINQLKQKSFNVIVIMTRSGSQMVDPKEFEIASGNTVYLDLFEKDFDYKTVLEKREVDHIQIADAASLFVIIPATANIIAKVAHGLADDFLTTSLLATKAPILLCPSMNVNMWHNPVVQENITKAKALGIQFIEPDSGMLACGYEGKGRLADISEIEKEIEFFVKKTTELQGKKIIITAGGTIEPIDGIRFITNRSSGKMGIAIADACYQRGADVLLLRANHSVTPRFPMQQETFDTADELTALVKKNISLYDTCFHSAAVSDFSLTTKRQGKLKSNKALSLDLVPREKILRVMKQGNPTPRLFAFKAEWGKTEEELAKIAKEKIIEFDLDGVLANDVSKREQGFEVDSNELLLVTKDEKEKLFPFALKRTVANEVIDYLIAENLL